MDPTYKGLGTPTPSKLSNRSFNLRPALLLGGGGLAVVIVVSLLFNAFTPDTTTLSQRLLYRLEALTTTMSTASKNIRDASLSKINSDTHIVLTGDLSDIRGLLPTVQTSKELADIKKAEADEQTVTKLKDAVINGRHDTVYRTVFSQKLETLNALVNELHQTTGSTKLKAALKTLHDHIKTYYDQLNNAAT